MVDINLGDSFLCRKSEFDNKMLLITLTHKSWKGYRWVSEDKTGIRNRIDDDAYNTKDYINNNLIGKVYTWKLKPEKNI